MMASSKSSGLNTGPRSCFEKPELKRSSTTATGGLIVSSALGKAADAKSVDDDVVVVTRPGVKDLAVTTASEDSILIPLSTIAVLKAALARGRKQGMIRCLVGGTTNGTSAANTANAFVSGLDVTSAADYAAFAGVYDEARCTGANLHFIVTSSGVPTTVSTLWSANFDPTNSAAPVSEADCRINQVSIGPYLAWNSQTIFPQIACIDGRGRMPCIQVKSGALATPLSLGTGPNVNLVGGDWYPTAATSAVVGFAKLYVGALGAGVSSTVTLAATYHMEFRMRS